MTDRYGIKPAPTGCGGQGDAPCESCVQRFVSLRRWIGVSRVRRLRWGVRQLLPLTYRTRYHTMDGTEHFVVWRMWLGRVFAVDRVNVAP